MTLPWKGKTQYQVHVETLELAARIADKYACGLCGMDGKCAAEIRALSPAPYPEPARLHPVASESTDDIASGKRNLFTELKEGFRELASRPVDEPMQDTGNVEVDRLIGRLMSADPDFSDCTDAAAFIRRLVAAPVAVGDAKRAELDQLILEYGISRHDEMAAVTGAQNAIHRQESARLYAEIWAALASQAAPDALHASKQHKPIMWFCSSDPDDDGWIVHKESEAQEYEREGCDVTPLYDTPQPDPAVALTEEQIRTIEHAATKLENIGHIFSGDKESRRLGQELKAIVAAQPASTTDTAHFLADLRRKIAAAPRRQIESAPGVYTSWLDQGAVLDILDAAKGEQQP